MGLGPFYREFLSGSTCEAPLPSWEICGLSGRVRAHFKELTPMSQNSGTWSDYFVFVQNPLKFAKCWMDVHAFFYHGRPNYFGRSLNPWTKLIHCLWYFLLDSLSHELTWTWFGHGQLHGRMECDSTHHQNYQMWEKKKKKKETTK